MLSTASQLRFPPTRLIDPLSSKLFRVLDHAMQYFHLFALLLCLITPAWSRPLLQPQAVSDTQPPPPPIIHVVPSTGFSTESVIEICAIFATILCCIVNLAWPGAWRKLRGRWRRPLPDTLPFSEPVDTRSPSSAYAASTEDSTERAADVSSHGMETEEFAKAFEMSNMENAPGVHDHDAARESV
jgi:hypothetical protein